jgi:1,4-dihydroxy-2-naphthoate octaprenyltransferase
MSTKVAMKPAPILGSRAEASLEAEKSKNARAIIGTMILATIATIAALAALMFGLFHGVGWQERLVMMIGAAAIAGGATYTFQRFLKGPRKSSTGEDGEV